jgi:hypothetical protein
MALVRQLGGLTVKPVDVDELLRVVDPTRTQPIMVDAAATGRYPLPEAGCTLVRLDAARRTPRRVTDRVGLDGTAWYVPTGHPHPHRPDLHRRPGLLKPPFASRFLRAGPRS